MEMAKISDGLASWTAPAPDVTLDPKDGFERAMIRMITTYRRKKADYAHDLDPYSNFRDTSRFAGFEAPWLSALFNVSQKLARITSLRANGRLSDPRNEGVLDTVEDSAVYGVIALAIYLDEMDAPLAPLDVRSADYDAIETLK